MKNLNYLYTPTFSWLKCTGTHHIFTCGTLYSRRCDFQKSQGFTILRKKKIKLKSSAVWTSVLLCAALFLQNLLFIVATLIISNFPKGGKFCKPVRCQNIVK